MGDFSYRLGYRGDNICSYVKEEKQIINIERIKEKLTTKVLGREILYLGEVDSTNLEASRLYKSGKLTDGLVILTERQSAGRGRMERNWLSSGCLTMTAVFKFDKGKQNISAVTLTAGSAIVSAMRELTGIDFLLKYPNDIMFNGRKFGGILCEMKTGESTFVSVGIGLNLFQESFPKEVASTAISLKQIGLDTSFESVIPAILNSLEVDVGQFKEKGFPAVKNLWLKNNCTIGKEVIVDSPSGIIEGRAVGIDDDGALIMETVNGKERVMTGDFRLREK